MHWFALLCLGAIVCCRGALEELADEESSVSLLQVFARHRKIVSHEGRNLAGDDADVKDVAKIQSLTRRRENVAIWNVSVGAMVVETRCHVALPLVVQNMRDRLPSLPILMFHSSQNADCVKTWFSDVDKLVLVELDESYWVGSGRMMLSALFTNAAFWKLVPYEKVLFFHQNSWVCGNESQLKRFLQFDYIGAPWRPDQGGRPGCGNGGFSLRTVKAMHDISAKFGQSMVSEDIYFCEHMKAAESAPKPVISVSLPSVGDAEEFAAETYDGSLDHAPFGTHEPYRYSGWFASDNQFRRHCPDLDLLERANAEGNVLLANTLAAVQRGREFVAELVARNSSRILSLASLPDSSPADFPFATVLPDLRHE